jgi:hypothetical protein
MHSPARTAEVPARNPIARSLALAVLGVALVAAAIMGAVVFAVLLGVFVIGYLFSLANAWLRKRRVRRRIATLEQPQSPTAQVEVVEAEYEIVEAAADAAPRGPGGAA